MNYINFSLDAENYVPKKAWQGIGSSASINADLRQFWGGGSTSDDFSPITMGMFATSKYWWNQGQMDAQLKTWGGENVEISLRYGVHADSIVERGCAEGELSSRRTRLLLMHSGPSFLIR